MGDNENLENQGSLFDSSELESDWEKEWVNMPEYSHKDLTPYKQIVVSFESREDMKLFANLVGQKLTIKTQSIWYPEVKIGRYANKRYIDES